eukprot:gene8325-17138_t
MTTTIELSTASAIICILSFSISEILPLIPHAKSNGILHFVLIVLHDLNEYLNNPFIGHRGSGKTHALVNLAKRYLDEGSFTRVFCISLTFESNPVFHVLGIKKEDVYSNVHNSIAAIEDILAKCKTDSDDFDDYEAYMNAYRKWKRGKNLKLDEHTMPENNDFQKPPEIPRPSPLIVIDDMSHSDIYSTSRQNPSINLCLRHRHINHGKGCSIFMCVQNFRSGIPLALRQNLQVMCIWPTHDSGQLEAIFHEVANLIDQETFMHLYHQATKDPYSFLTIDTCNIPAKQFRKNFDISLIPVIKNNSESEEDL